MLIRVESIPCTHFISHGLKRFSATRMAICFNDNGDNYRQYIHIDAIFAWP